MCFQSLLTTRTYLRLFVLLGLLGIWPATQAVAQSGLMGDFYTYSHFNFPGDFGETEDPVSGEFFENGEAAILTFDGVEEVVAGMRINESVTPWEGVAGGIPAEQAAGIDGETEFDLIDWENSGEIVEFSFRSESGAWISNDLLDHSFITLRDLEWQNSEDQEPFFYETGFYIYYSKDGVPATGYETTLPEIGLLAGKHPTEPDTDVFYIAYSQGQIDEVSDSFPAAMDLKFGTTQLAAEASWAALAQVMAVDDQIAQGLNGLHLGFLVTPPESTFVPILGDVNFDGVIDIADFDAMSVAIRTGETAAQFDVDENGSVNADDRLFLVEQIANTYVGDANNDGVFDSGDFVTAFTFGEYEDAVDGNSTWAEGDWDGSGDFDSGDFVAAFSRGGYEQGPRAAVAAVPEPSAAFLLTLGLLLIRRKK